MLSNEKIQIGVEIVNNTGPSLARIKSDIKTMTTGTQAAMSASNTLMTHSWQKAASIIGATVAGATSTVSGSFQTMQISASSSAQKIKTDFSESAKTISNSYSSTDATMDSFKKTLDAQVQNLTELVDALESGKMAFDDYKVAVERVLKANDKTQKSFKAYKDSIFNVNSIVSEEIALLDSHKKKQKEDIAVLEEAVKAEVQYIRESKNITSAIESEIAALNKLRDSKKSDASDTDASTAKTKKQDSQLAMLAKRFLTIAAAIWAVKRAYQAALTSVKLYEEQSGKGSTGGYARIGAEVGQIGIEIGSVLEKQFTALADYMQKNSAEIEANARQIANVTANLILTLMNVVKMVSSTINAVVGSVVTGIMAIVSGVLNLINNTVMKIPGIPKGIKEGFDNATKWIDESTATWVEFTKQGFQDIGDSAKDFGKSFAALWESLYTKPAASGIKYVTDKQKEALEKRKQDMAAFLAWVAQLQDRYDQATLSEFEYRRKKANVDAQADKIKLIQWEKSLNLDLTQYKIQVEQLRAAAIDKIDKEELDRKIERINQLEQAQKEAYQAAVSAAKAAGIGSGSIQKTPGSPRSAVATQAFTGRADIATQVEEMTKAYDMMVETGKFSTEELAQARIDIETNTVNAIKQLDYDLLQSRMQNMQSYVSMFTDVAKSITEIGSNMVQIQMNDLNKQTEEKQKSLEDAYDFDAKYVKNKKKLDKSYDDAKNKLAEEQAQKQRELYKKQKGWSVANALIAGAEASMNSWVQAMKLGYPANVIVGGIMQGVITALTASQVAVIGSQKFATGGIVQGPTTGDKVTIQANGGEMMLTTGQQARLYQALNGQGTLGQQITISGDTFIVHGNLDKNAADQIIRQKEQRISVLRNDLRELNYRGQLSFA